MREHLLFMHHHSIKKKKKCQAGLMIDLQSKISILDFFNCFFIVVKQSLLHIDAFFFNCLVIYSELYKINFHLLEFSHKKEKP